MHRFYTLHEFECADAYSSESNVGSRFTPSKIAFCSRILSSFQKRVNNAHYFVNIDQTPVFMNFAPHRTVRRKGKNTVPIRVGCKVATFFAGTCRGNGWNRTALICCI